ncbi:hypothetical protein Nepgr_017008 [Nepenthes gracilis]|uniref:Uncharacterized protein n=1 Tax=Nepenthes gracilis TaxID=150966 RepID=A0AAD3SRK8_NEPGR|nr:hypothetical protein Nepgr_017008 [Nepenthes gracilis]
MPSISIRTQNRPAIFKTQIWISCLITRELPASPIADVPVIPLFHTLHRCPRSTVIILPTETTLASSHRCDSHLLSSISSPASPNRCFFLAAEIPVLRHHCRHICLGLKTIHSSLLRLDRKTHN